MGIMFTVDIVAEADVEFAEALKVGYQMNPVVGWLSESMPDPGLQRIGRLWMINMGFLLSCIKIYSQISDARNYHVYSSSVPCCG